MNRPEDARHICRICGKEFPPQRNAHTRLALHVARVHKTHVSGYGGWVVPCHTQCEFRATPSEGRYTATYTPRGDTPKYPPDS